MVVAGSSSGGTAERSQHDPMVVYAKFAVVCTSDPWCCYCWSRLHVVLCCRCVNVICIRGVVAERMNCVIVTFRSRPSNKTFVIDVVVVHEKQNIKRPARRFSSSSLIRTSFNFLETRLHFNIKVKQKKSFPIIPHASYVQIQTIPM